MGHHRGKVFDDEDLQKELIEIDENLIRNELCYIAAGRAHPGTRTDLTSALKQEAERFQPIHRGRRPDDH